jgi:hypothetical protein
MGLCEWHESPLLEHALHLHWREPFVEVSHVSHTVDEVLALARCFGGCTCSRPILCHHAPELIERKRICCVT